MTKRRVQAHSRVKEDTEWPVCVGRALLRPINQYWWMLEGYVQQAGGVKRNSMGLTDNRSPNARHMRGEVSIHFTCSKNQISSTHVLHQNEIRPPLRRVGNCLWRRRRLKPHKPYLKMLVSMSSIKALSQFHLNPSPLLKSKGSKE